MPTRHGFLLWRTVVLLARRVTRRRSAYPLLWNHESQLSLASDACLNLTALPAAPRDQKVEVGAGRAAQTCSPSKDDGEEEIGRIWRARAIEHNTRYFNVRCTDLAWVSSNLHTPFSLASRLPMILFLFFSFAALILARFSSNACLALLARAGFSRRIWRP